MVKSAILIAVMAGLTLLSVSCARREAPPPPALTRINAQGLEIIKESEKLKLTSYRLHDQWYIGYGHMTAGPGEKISEGEAERLLRQDLEICEKAVREKVTAPLSANEFSAMTALCYNIGAPNFSESSVVTRFNAGDRQGAANAFLMLTKAKVDGKKTSLDALEERRRKERTLFLSS